MLDKIKYEKENSGYVLLEDYYYCSNFKPPYTVEHEYFTMTTSGLVIIRKGYWWNGASGIKDTKYNLRASLVHDTYWQAMELYMLPVKYRSKTDKVFVDIAKEDGMNHTIANLHFWGLRIYGTFKFFFSETIK